MVIAETASAFPVYSLGYAAFIFIVDDFLQTGKTMGFAVVSQFNADPAATHFMGYCGGGAGTEKGVEDEVAWVGGDVEYSLN